MSMSPAIPGSPTAVPSWAACIACGINVRGPFDPDALETVTSYGHQTFEITLTRCEICTAIRDTADDLMRAHPVEAFRIGDRSIAVHRLELALDGIDALGIADAKRIDRLTNTGADVRALIEYMAVPGGVARWGSRLVAATGRGERVESHAPERWAGVPGGQRQALRDAAAALFQVRIEKPVPVLCPEGGGCMLCGVRAVVVLPSKARGVWVEMSADAVTLGGPDAPDMIDGCVCPRCDQAIDRAEGVGQSAMRLSVLDLLGVPAHLFTVSQIDGLRAWAVMPGVRPNATPWAHVDLSALREEVGA
jgi:hypothetical protein